MGTVVVFVGGFGGCWELGILFLDYYPVFCLGVLGAVGVGDCWWWWLGRGGWFVGCFCAVAYVEEIVEEGCHLICVSRRGGGGFWFVGAFFQEAAFLDEIDFMADGDFLV